MEKTFMPTDPTQLSDEAQSLARVPLFKRLEPHELEKLAEEIDQVDYKAGEVIFNEHDHGDALYVVEEGSVRIWVTDEDLNEVTLAELQPGQFFGELAVLDRGERSSSATAITDAHLHRLSSDDFQKFLIEHADCHRCHLRNRCAHAANQPAGVAASVPQHQS